MSNFLAVGGVSESLRALLLDRMELPQDAIGFRVSIGAPRPDSQVMLDAPESPRINLFLYRVDENAALKNQQIPGHGNSSSYGNPPLSLDLHYLVTGYGTREQQQGRFDETLAQFLLGSAMRVFHDFAIFTEALVTTRPPLGLELLHDSLRGEFERIKISLEPVSLEDISKIWTALTLPFRVSASYVVNVIQIESERAQSFPRRVKPAPAGPNIIVIPFRHPHIDDLRVHWSIDLPGAVRTAAYASIGDTLILLGQNFASSSTRVRIGELEVNLGTTFDDQRLEVIVPDGVLPDGTVIPDAQRLQPGVLAVSLIAGLPELAQTGFPSNQTAFMLTPRVTTVVPALGVAPRTVTITGRRLFNPRLSGETLIGRAVVPKILYTSAAETHITVPIPDSVPGYPIHVLVSGALGALPATIANTSMQVQIGLDGPHKVDLPRNPTDFQDLAGVIERALRTTANVGSGFLNVRVGITSDQRLVIVPGGVRDTVTVAGGGPADDLLLTTVLSAQTMEAYQSGPLADPPPMSAAAPAMNFTLAGTPATVNLSPHPPSLAVLVQNLETSIQTANPAFAAAPVRVASAGSQLVVMAGVASPIAFAPVPSGDAITIAELDLAETAPVRVRMNGAESLTDNPVDLTK